MYKPIVRTHVCYPLITAKNLTFGRKFTDRIDFDNKIFFKVTNKDEMHYGHKYIDGLNVLPYEFNHSTRYCREGDGFYFTTRHHIHNFYEFGCYLRMVMLPEHDPTFVIKNVGIIEGFEFRANKIILGPRYPLSKMETYERFGIKLPKCQNAITHGYYDIVEHMINIGHCNNERYGHLLYLATKHDLNFLKLLVRNGFDNVQDLEKALLFAVDHGKYGMVEYLANKLPKSTNWNHLLLIAIRNGDFGMVKMLRKYGANICYVHNLYGENYPLKLAIEYGHFTIIKYLVDNGAKITFDLPKYKQWQVVGYNLVKRYF